MNEIKPKVFTSSEWDEVWQEAMEYSADPYGNKPDKSTRRQWKFPWLEAPSWSRSNQGLKLPFEIDDDERHFRNHWSRFQMVAARN